MAVGDTQKQVSQFPVRHCERSEAIQGPQYDRLGCWRRACCGPWIASSQGLLAMTSKLRGRKVVGVGWGYQLGSGSCAGLAAIPRTVGYRRDGLGSRAAARR